MDMGAITFDVLGQSYTVKLLLLVLAGAVIRTLYRAYGGPTARIPGPWVTRFTRFWELRAVSRGDFEHTNIALHKKYGPIVRTAPFTFSINDPAVVKQIYLGGSAYPKAGFYKCFGSPIPEEANIFSDTNIKQHAVNRRKIASLYAMSTVVGYEEFVDRCNGQFAAKLREFAATRTAFDVTTWMQHYAYDVIGEITFGKSFGIIERGHDTDNILHSVDEVLAYGARMGVFPELHPWVAWVTGLLGIKIPFYSVMEYIYSQINSRSDADNTGNDFLTKLLALRKTDKISRVDVDITIGNNIAAGSDTTASTLAAVVYYLRKHPQAEAKLREEIDALAGEGKISDPVTFDEARRMPYLQACIKEVLRIHPAVGRLLARIVPPEGATLSGQYFPGGTTVGVSPWVLHYNEDVFGPDVTVFRPERWLEADKDRLSLMDQSSISFGVGSRTCIGKNISLLEMSKVIPQLYRQFEFELVNPDGKWATWNDLFVKQKFDCYVKERRLSTL
ncbi:cytochrome P450 [Aspergillus avenaceus]|uniref:Cytochrome P450 n=1 Tax=Aspergillus avenaceus TaxID=36643 RepID=A0A5N6TVR3_ASPAV|nr:cytochrome P450 [Aspergillus avenaceus]